MRKSDHEVRDPIHVFVRLSSDEREVLDSRPVQRLRHIHQLALTHLVYPGATHRRFEHSLGVMALADRVFGTVVRDPDGRVRDEFPELTDEGKRAYWRSVLRVAALCHDVGHLPFSHAAEGELLPEGWTHESMTALVIRSPEMQQLWAKMKIQTEDVVKLALGLAELPGAEFSPWETILSEIIVGDAFGVDRMDYLLRDSHHAGVPYGRFDHHRLIDTLRILPAPPSDQKVTHGRFALGVEEGGIQSAEALMIARYFMYSQVYYHPVRRIYDIHLRDFLQSLFPGGKYPVEVEGHLRLTDTEVTSAMSESARDPQSPGFAHAFRIMQHRHFKRIYTRNPIDAQVNLEAGKAVYEALRTEFGEDRFRHDRYRQKGGAPDFPVLLDNGEVASSLAVSSEVLANLPTVNVDYVFADREIAADAENWIKENRGSIVQPRKE